MKKRRQRVVHLHPVQRESVVGVNRTRSIWNGLLSGFMKVVVEHVYFTLRSSKWSFFDKLGGTADLTSFVPLCESVRDV